jgi:hypothetical protein
MDLTDRPEANTCLLLFFLPRDLVREVIPDYEVIRCKKFFSQTLLRYKDCHEAYFGLARLYMHLRNYERA